MNSPEDAAAAAAALKALGVDESANKEFSIPQKFTKSGRKRAVPFPIKLMKVLSDKNFSHIITWMPSGDSFSIVKPKAFVAEILPDHFKSAKYSSFTRKLHRWGFMRHYRGDEAGAFYHKDFKKDRLDLVEKMTCKAEQPAKAPVAKKTLAIQGVVKAAPKVGASAMRLVPQATVPQLKQQQPFLPSGDLIAQLQQQQQQLKTPELSAAEKLNAAIEMEVTRRLKERIQQAAVSRQALVLAQHFHPPSSARPQWGMASAGSLQAQLIQMQQQKQRLGLEASCIGGLSSGFPKMDSRGLDELPKTNIQSAKTA